MPLIIEGMGESRMKQFLAYAAAFVAITVFVMAMPWSMDGDDWTSAELCQEYQRVTASGPASGRDLVDMAKHAPQEMAQQLISAQGPAAYMNRNC